MQKSLEKFFAVDEKRVFPIKSPQESPFSQIGKGKTSLKPYKIPNVSNEFPNKNPMNFIPVNMYSSAMNPNSKVSHIMSQEREKAKSHENKMQFFFEKNIEDYSKPLQKQEVKLKQSYIDYRKNR